MSNGGSGYRFGGVEPVERLVNIGLGDVGYCFLAPAMWQQ